MREERSELAKMRLCSKCGITLNEIKPGVFSCPRGHGEWPERGEAKIIREPLNATYAGGPVEYGGTKATGRKKKKQSRKEQWNSFYAEL